ncbi:hypothetical protein [Luteolibacter sp. LG18]|uniref:hypothetical protein n=1 Tax=Luteolibacter sp. LG18 TaxID=2819286 RepID=UPI002B2A9D51|nr:hypothetical protein llg_44740 [Luteolibacter sp. LG18]
MPRILFLLAALLIAGAILARGWYGKRILIGYGGRRGRVNVEVWRGVFGEEPKALPAEATAEEHGRALREAALERWHRDDPPAARAREAARRFGLGVPPFTLVAVVFAVMVAKLAIFTGLAVVMAATALATMFGLVSIGSELKAVAVACRIARERHLFPRREDEDAVIACAEAEVWMQALPPILRWVS